MKTHGTHKDISLVTIIIPAYNVEDYVERCIGSVINQTYENVEIIVIDDGSTDKTGELSDRMAVLDQRIRVIHKENGGLSDAMNWGLENALGEYIAFLDADDTYHPRYIGTLFEALRVNACDIAQCEFLCTNDLNDHVFDMKEIIEEVMTGLDAARHCADDKCAEYIVAWNKLYKRELFEDIRYPLGEINEDQFSTWKIFLKAEKIVYVRSFLYMHLQRQGSLMGSRFSRRHMQVIDAYIERSRFFHDHGYHKEALNMLRWAKDDYIIGIKKLTEQEENVDDLIERIDVIDCELKLREEDYYRFPYEKVKKDVTVVIYGVGLVGMAYYRQLNKNTSYKKVMLVDRFAIRDRKEVDSIDHVLDDKDAYVVIAIENENKAKEVRRMLIRMGIDEERIVWSI